MSLEELIKNYKEIKRYCILNHITKIRRGGSDFFLSNDHLASNFLYYQRHKRKDNQLSDKELVLLNRYDTFIEKLEYHIFRKKINEIKKIYDQYFCIPASIDSLTMFSNYNEILDYLTYLKNKNDRNQLKENQKRLYCDFQRDYSIFRIKLRELDKTCQSLGQLPCPCVRINEGVNIYTRSFSIDQSDMGQFVRYYQDKLKKKQLVGKDKILFERVITKYNLFSLRIDQLIEFSEKTYEIPVINRHSTKRSKIFCFQDGVDAGSWLTTQKSKLKKNQLSDKETHLLTHYLEQYQNYSFYSKMIELTIFSLQRYQQITESKLDHNIVFSNGNSMSHFFASLRTKMKNKKMSQIEEELFTQYLSIDYEQAYLWDLQFLQFANDYLNHKEESDDVKEFIQCERKLYSLPNKDMVQLIHEEQLKCLNPHFFEHCDLNESQKNQQLKKIIYHKLK